ncbi:expressed unknown protein [Seminavis robusta]|uniref:Uncharacterized protein n=1 Tax=Seminavis robusta TaxID=568900 RepID=A0A9N8EEV5_9STRA|nr:expressed unknown protein [Seminavis robusta]|eukprot:Sro1021_g232300.1 n/a (134) ;mRNA; f:39041-39442
MLEEALRDPNKHPAEVATAMLSFIRSDLVNGGSSSEERFYQLFLPLCNRVFGEIMQDNKLEYKHQAGGWLSAEQRWKTPSTTQVQQHSYGRSVKRSPPQQSTKIRWCSCWGQFHGLLQAELATRKMKTIPPSH